VTLSDKESEADVRYRYIDPMLRQVGWADERILLERPINNGQIAPEGRGGKRIDSSIKKPDYVLEYAPNVKIAVIEAKSRFKLPEDGMQQAKEYASLLNVSFAYSSNGKGIKEFDFLTGIQRSVDKIPSPEELWQRLNKSLKFDSEKTKQYLTPLNKDSETPDGKIKEPRYYQENAINEVMKAILAGKKNILLSLATGTGKTFIAFQVAWKLWKSNSPKPKILFLTDRLALQKQAHDKDFKPFDNARHKIQSKANTSYDMYFALYQALGVDKEDGTTMLESELYKQYPIDFFDYVIVDECHRGVSNAESSWRKILDYFGSAVHIGMTATPQRKSTIDDTFRYFGEPVYEYSLKQGIEDGFLAPFIVDRRLLDIDVSGYVPKQGDVDNNGNPLDKPLYTVNDFDRLLTIKSRQEQVAKYIFSHLQSTGKYDKTIVFCQGSRHASQMVELLNNLAKDDPNYCVRIVADEGEVGKKFLDEFSNPKEKFPVVAVTSRLMSTGIDAPTCRNIIIDRIINSMTEFKQIIGRGTRVYELDDKLWFTIIDFRGATELFDDPEWDGPGLPPLPPVKGQPHGNQDPRPERPWLEIDGDKVQVIGRYVRIYDPVAENGQRLISFEQFTGNTVKRLESDFGMELKQIWSDMENRKHFVLELEKRGITITHVQQIMENHEADVFDILLNLAYRTPIKTRRQRVERVRNKKSFLEKNPQKAREVLEVLMEHYAEVGYQELDLDNTHVLRLDKFKRFGGDYAIINEIFIGIDNYTKTVNELVHQIYEA